MSSNDQRYDMNQIEAMRRRIMELRRAAGDHGIGGGSNPVIQASASSVSATAAATMDSISSAERAAGR